MLDHVAVEPQRDELFGGKLLRPASSPEGGDKRGDHFASRAHAREIGLRELRIVRVARDAAADGRVLR